MEVRFTVPGEPRGWQRTGLRVVRSKTTGKHIAVPFTKTQTRAEQTGIKFIASAAMQGRAPLDCALTLEATFYLPVPRSWSGKKQAAALAGHLVPVTKPDVDNCAKLLCDALNKVVWRDDSLVASATILKQYSDRPRIDVVVRPRTLECP